MRGDTYASSPSWQSYRAVQHSSITDSNQSRSSNAKQGSTWMSYTIYACNIVMLVAGTASLAVGAWLRTDSRFRDFLSQRYRNVVEEAFWQAPTLYIFSYILIILGMCMIVVSMFGCCGAANDSRILLVMYCVAVAILMVATISASAYILFKKYGIDVEVSDALTYMVQHYYQGAGIIQESLDRLQQAFRCCGNSGCGDFRVFRQDPPRSCDIRCDGCHYRIMLALQIGFSAAFVIFIAVVIAELVAIAVSLMMVMRERKSRKYIGNDPSAYIVRRDWRGNDEHKNCDSLRSDDCPLSGFEHRSRFVAHPKYR